VQLDPQEHLARTLALDNAAEAGHRDIPTHPVPRAPFFRRVSELLSHSRISLPRLMPVFHIQPALREGSVASSATSVASREPLRQAQKRQSLIAKSARSQTEAGVDAAEADTESSASELQVRTCHYAAGSH
jgi:hypothetical protein